MATSGPLKHRSTRASGSWTCRRLKPLARFRSNTGVGTCLLRNQKPEGAVIHALAREASASNPERLFLPFDEKTSRGAVVPVSFIASTMRFRVHFSAPP